MKKIIPRYLATSFILPFIGSGLFFVAFLLLFQLFKITKLVVNKGLSIWPLLEILLHIALTFLPMAIPLSVLFASIFALSRISLDSEFMAMRAIGLTKFQILRPFLIISLFIAMATLSLSQTIIPESTRQFKTAITALTSKGILSNIKKGQFFSDIPGVIIYANDILDKGQVLKNIFIRFKTNNETKVIFAKEGQLHKSENTKFGSTGIELLLTDGSITSYPLVKNNLEKILFKEYQFPVSTGNLSASFMSKDSMKSGGELFQELKAGLLENNPEEIKKFTKTKIEFWARINTSILIIIFCFLGFTLGVKKTRGKNRGTTSIVIFILVFYYGFYFLGIGLSNSGHIPAEVSVFLPTIICFFITIRLFNRLEWLG